MVPILKLQRADNSWSHGKCQKFSLMFFLRLYCKRPRKRPDCQNSTESKPSSRIYPRLLNPHPPSSTTGLGTVLLGLGFSRTISPCHCFLQSLCITSVPLQKWSHTVRMLKCWKFCMKPNPSKETTATVCVQHWKLPPFRKLFAPEVASVKLSAPC